VTPDETLRIVRFVRAACPQQKLDEYTPDAWHILLADIAYTDALTATQTLAKRQPFVSPAEIIGEVKRIRADRLRAHGNAEPDADGDDARAYLAAIRAYRKAIADGYEVQPPPRPSIEGQKRVEELIGAAGTLPADLAHAAAKQARRESAARRRAEDAARVERHRQRRLAIEAARAELSEPA
jgi:hypothetical protein